MNISMDTHGPICTEPFAALELLAQGCDTAWTCVCGRGWVTEVTGERVELADHLGETPRISVVVHENTACELCTDHIAEGSSYMASVEKATSRIVAKAHIDCADVHGFKPGPGQKVKRMKARDTAKYPLAF